MTDLERDLTQRVEFLAWMLDGAIRSAGGEIRIGRDVLEVMDRTDRITHFDDKANGEHILTVRRG